jgi:hypothetical protein
MPHFKYLASSRKTFLISGSYDVYKNLLVWTDCLYRGFSRYYILISRDFRRALPASLFPSIYNTAPPAIQPLQNLMKFPLNLKQIENLTLYALYQNGSFALTRNMLYPKINESVFTKKELKHYFSSIQKRTGIDSDAITVYGWYEGPGYVVFAPTSDGSTRMMHCIDFGFKLSEIYVKDFSDQRVKSLGQLITDFLLHSRFYKISS